jgi:hypothetical protein
VHGCDEAGEIYLGVGDRLIDMSVLSFRKLGRKRREAWLRMIVSGSGRVRMTCRRCYEDALPIVKEMVKKTGIRAGAWVNGLAAERAAMMGLGGDGSEGHLLVHGNEWEL